MLCFCTTCGLGGTEVTLNEKRRYMRSDQADLALQVPRECYARSISAPIIFAIPGDRTPNLTTILITTDRYTPYPNHCPWSRPSHSLMAVRLMFTSCQILHHAYRTATHLDASCISSPLYDPYLASCSSHVFPLTLNDSPSSYRV